ncbi:MAG: Crp/Fnr family transcriptional regulator [Betaproteobacteria bacterium]|nr:Crp/Fnr family transcriptional regulator [Betaproteobacteria bacterium]
MQSTLDGLWGLSHAHAVALAPHCKTLSARRGEVIARRGSPLPGVMLMSIGSAKLSVRGAEGDERVLRIASAGDAFGEPTAMLGKPCLYDAVALSDVRVVILPASAILALVARDRRFARFVVLALSARSYTVLSEFSAATTQRGAQRLAGYLGSLERKNGSRGPTVQLPVSKTVVAALLGMKKETLSRLFRQFSSEGLIGMTRREIAILDPQGLAACVSSG